MKKLTNKHLVGFLMEHRHIEMVTVSKKQIIATVDKSFKPSEVPELIKAVGQKPRLATQDNVNYIIFPRY